MGAGHARKVHSVISGLGFEPYDISPSSGGARGLGMESEDVSNESVNCTYMMKPQEDLWTGHSDELLATNTLHSHAPMPGRQCVPQDMEANLCPFAMTKL